MNQQKEFFNMPMNKLIFGGRVAEDPTFSEGYAFLKVRTSNREQDANGQWVDAVTEALFMTNVEAKVKTIREYFKKDRDVLIEANYKSWVDVNGQQAHAFIIQTMSFGSPNQKRDTGTGGGQPTVPTPYSG